MLVLWILFAGASASIFVLLPLAVALLIFFAIIMVSVALISPLAATCITLILAPLRVLIATEAAFQLPLDIGQIGLSIILLALFFHRVPATIGLRSLVKHAPQLFFAFASFLLIALINMFAAESITGWVNEFIKWLQIVLLVVIVIGLSRCVHWRWFILAVIAAGASNAIVGSYQYFGGSGALHLLVNERFFRAFGTFGQPNPFGGFLGTIAPIAIAVGIGSTAAAFERWHHMGHGYVDRALVTTALLSSIVAILLSSGIVMSWSRGAWIGLAAAIAVMAVAAPQNAWKGLGLGALAVLLVTSLWATDVLPSAIQDRIRSSGNELFTIQDVRGIDIDPANYAVVERLAHWQAALNMTRNSPWLGVGFGNYEVKYDEFSLINWFEPLGHAHNYYLNILAEMGLIGLLVYGKVWLIIFTMSWKARKHPDPLARAVVVGLLGTWTYFSVHSLFDNLYVNNVFLHLGVLIGVLVVIFSQVHINTEVSS